MGSGDRDHRDRPLGRATAQEEVSRSEAAMSASADNLNKCRSWHPSTAW